MAGIQRKQPQLGKPQLTFMELSRLVRARAKEYTLLGLFKFGYRNKEDVSNLPPNTLVVGSQNVLTNAAEQVGIRPGYVLDGPAGNQNTYGVDSSYDFLARTGLIQNLRKWGGNLEVRYVNAVTSAVTWINLITSLSPNNLVNFCDFFDATNELKRFCLFVNGDINVYEWSGAVGSFASASNATGIIATLNATSPIGSGGAGYAVGDVLTLVGGNSDATAKVIATSPGGVATFAIAAGGASYNVNDTITLQVQGGTLQATLRVLTVDGGGAILTATITVAGNGYYAGQTCTATTSGGGTNATITVSTIGNTVSAIQLVTNGSGYSAATVATTGGTGTGCTVVIATVGNYSITLSGSLTTAQLGFYDAAANASKFKVIINGTTYGYTAANGNSGMTLIGISSDPTLASIVAGDAVIQAVAIGKSTSASFMGAQFKIDLIAMLSNQIWYGSFNNNNVYVSKTNDYTSVTYSTPARLPAEGALCTLDAPPVGFSPQASQMYLSAGRDQWWVSQSLKTTVVVAGVATPTEALYVARIKTSFNQGAQSQGLIGRFKNSLIYVSNETIINALGLVRNISGDPQIVNMSDPIKNDVDAYDFTGGQIVYDNYFIYVLIPINSVLRMYNVVKKYWEAPQVMPLSRLYHVSLVKGNALYGHSSLTNESYQLFTGYNDNGNPIKAVAAFAYTSQEGGTANEKKSFNKFFTEGYLSANATLMVTLNYDFGGYTGTYTTIISGSNKAIIFNKITDGSLGQNSLGSEPIGTILNVPANSSVPKFRVINTMPRLNCFEYQVIYSSNDVDFNWTLLRFGPAISAAPDIPTEITE